MCIRDRSMEKLDKIEGTKDPSEWFGDGDEDLGEGEPLDVVKGSADEEVKGKRMGEGTDTPDYDSTYIPPPS